MQPLYLVIDQGGHGTRGLVYDTEGKSIVSVHSPLTTSNPHVGWFEQNPEDLQRSLDHCLARLNEKLTPAIADRIHSAALITQRSSLVACRKDTLQAISPILSWQDTRNSQWLQSKIDGGAFDLPALKQLTGLRLNGHYGASKMRWLLEHNVAVQSAADKNNLVFLPLAAYVTHLLTKNKIPIVDAATASRTFLAEFGKQEWSHMLLKQFAIAAEYLPEIVPTRFNFGDIRIAGRNIPLQVVSGDQSFLPFAYGEETFNNSLYINAGTGAFVQTGLTLASTPSTLLCSLAAIDAQQHLTVAEGTVNACASALDWLFEKENQELTTNEIEQALATCYSPPVFTHRLTALGSPYWLAAGESSFSEPATLSEKAVAVLESVIFLLAINCDLLQQAKPELQKIFISGGISHFNGFCQKLANCTRLPVHRCQDHEASSRGAAFFLAHVEQYPALGDADSFAVCNDTSLLARYQLFYEQLRKEWMQLIVDG